MNDEDEEYTLEDMDRDSEMQELRDSEADDRAEMEREDREEL